MMKIINITGVIMKAALFEVNENGNKKSVM